MKIRVKFSHIDIESIINAGEKSIGTSIMSKLRSAAAKGAVRYTPSVAEAVIEKKLKDFIYENELGIDIETTVLLKDEQTGGIKGIAASVSKIDYVMLFRAMRPLISDKLSEEKDTEIISEIMDVIGDDSDRIIGSVADILSDEKKATIIGALIKKYNKEICKSLNDAAQTKGLDLSVSFISVKP